MRHIGRPLGHRDRHLIHREFGANQACNGLSYGFYEPPLARTDQRIDGLIDGGIIHDVLRSIVNCRLPPVGARLEINAYRLRGTPFFCTEAHVNLVRKAMPSDPIGHIHLQSNP